MVQPALNRIIAVGEPMQVEPAQLEAVQLEPTQLEPIQLEPTQLEPRIMHVLVCLASRSGEVIGRQELLDTVWRGVVVQEEALTHAVSQLRRIFGDDRRDPRFIERIHKGGYRLIAPVTKSGVAVETEAGHEAGHEAEQEAGHEAGPEVGQPAENERAVGEAEPAVRGVPSARQAWARAAIALLVIIVILAATISWRLRTRTEEAPLSVVLRGVPFTSYPGRELLPALSPDGEQLAFSWDREEAEEYDLYVKQSNTATPLRFDHIGRIESDVILVEEFH